MPWGLKLVSLSGLALASCTALARTPLDAAAQRPFADRLLLRAAEPAPQEPELPVPVNAAPAGQEPETPATGSAAEPPDPSDGTPVAPVPEPAALQAAGDQYGPVRGESLVQLGFAADVQTITTSSQPDLTDVTLILQPSVGYFVTDNVELGLAVRGQYDILDKTDDVFSLRLQPFVNYNFRMTDRWWLYAGGQVGLQFTDTGPVSAWSGVFGGQVGTRHWVAQNVALFGQLGYTYVPQQEYLNIGTNRLENFDSHELLVLLGFTYAF